MIGLMDDQTMFDLFDSLKLDFESLKRELIQELKQELQPVKDGLARIEAELDRQISEFEGQPPT